LTGRAMRRSGLSATTLMYIELLEKMKKTEEGSRENKPEDNKPVENQPTDNIPMEIKPARRINDKTVVLVRHEEEIERNSAEEDDQGMEVEENDEQSKLEDPNNRQLEMEDSDVEMKNDENPLNNFFGNNNGSMIEGFVDEVEKLLEQPPDFSNPFQHQPLTYVIEPAPSNFHHPSISPGNSLALPEALEVSRQSSVFLQRSSKSQSDETFFKVPAAKLTQPTIQMTEDLFKSRIETNSLHGNAEEPFEEFPVPNDASDPLNNATIFTNFPDQEIDESIVPERCRTSELERSILLNEKTNVSTFYTSRWTRCSNKIVESYYKFQQPKDWNEVAQGMIDKFEPSIDYLYLKLNVPKEVTLGDKNLEIGCDLDLGEIQESLAEIEKSFEASEVSLVASTPKKADSSREDDDEIPLIEEKASENAGNSLKFDESSKKSIQIEADAEMASIEIRESLPEIEKPSEKPSIDQTKRSTRSSQKLSKLNQSIHQQSSKSVSDIFADIITTQQSMVLEEENLAQIQRAHSSDDEDFIGFSIQEQKEAVEIVNSMLVDVVQSVNPVEALQALTQENPK
jgi:hypothetical protein